MVRDVVDRKNRFRVKRDKLTDSKKNQGNFVGKIRLKSTRWITALSETLQVTLNSETEFLSSRIADGKSHPE